MNVGAPKMQYRSSELLYRTRFALEAWNTRRFDEFNL